MPDFNTNADLYRLEMGAVVPGKKNSPGPRLLQSGKVSDLMKKVLAKRAPDQTLYSITVPLEAGFGKDTLNCHDIEDFAEHPDFPN